MNFVEVIIVINGGNLHLWMVVPAYHTADSKRIRVCKEDRKKVGWGLKNAAPGFTKFCWTVAPTFGSRTSALLLILSIGKNTKYEENKKIFLHPLTKYLRKICVDGMGEPCHTLFEYEGLDKKDEHGEDGNQEY